MLQTAHDAYLESRIASADPIELVKVLYQGAAVAVRDARRHLAAGEIAERSRAITRAFEILTELATSLDRARGGEIATRLAQLYDYMQRRLTEANFAQSDEPLAEVLALLATLGEAWEGVSRQTSRPEPAPTVAAPWGQIAPETASHAWSF